MTDFSKITESILKLYPFTEEQLSRFCEKLTLTKPSRKDFLLKPGQISDCLTFVNAGSLRFYTKTENSELTLNFFTEQQWVADLESLLSQKPSNNYIEVFENSALFSITLTDIHALMDTTPSFRMLNALIADMTISTSHIATINTKSPDERYRTLLNTHPDWVNRFPQMQIASYLGMTPETLSRVRARII